MGVAGLVSTVFAQPNYPSSGPGALNPFASFALYFGVLCLLLGYFLCWAIIKIGPRTWSLLAGIVSLLASAVGALSLFSGGAGGAALGTFGFYVDAIPAALGFFLTSVDSVLLLVVLGVASLLEYAYGSDSGALYGTLLGIPVGASATLVGIFGFGAPLPFTTTDPDFTAFIGVVFGAILGAYFGTHIGSIAGAKVVLADDRQGSWRGPRNFSQLISAVLLLASAVLNWVSARTAWWTLAITGGGTSTHLAFLPGGSASLDVPGYPPSVAYGSIGLAQVGRLYAGVVCGEMIVIGLTLFAGIVALLCARGRLGERIHHGSVSGSTLLAAGVTLAVAITVALFQPALAGQSGNFGGYCAIIRPATSPCNSFWGTGVTTSGSLAWGPSIGWHLALASTALLIGAFVFWWLSAAQSRRRENERVFPDASLTASEVTPASPPAEGTMAKA